MKYVDRFEYFPLIKNHKYISGEQKLYTFVCDIGCLAFIKPPICRSAL